MRAFRYRLEALLTRAEHRERLLQIELARRQEEMAELDRQLGSARTLQRELHARVRDAFQTTRDPVRSVGLAPLRSLQQALDDVEELEAYITGVRQCVVEQIEETRQRLMEAARSRRVLEKHREKLADRHRRAALAAETKELDEVAGRARSPFVEALGDLASEEGATEA